MSDRLRIAEELLNAPLEEAGPGRFYATCPGVQHHTGRNGRKDFMVHLDGAPTGFCVHQSCSAEVEAFNLSLRRTIALEERTSGGESIDRYNREVAPLPRAERKRKRPPLDRDKVAKVKRACRIENLSEGWLRSVSPIDVSKWDWAQFFGALYYEDEKVLIFSSAYSQGEFLWWVGHGGFRLGNRPDVRAVRSVLPRGGADGIWFLTNPVSGMWERKRHLGKGGHPELSRRSETAVTSWRYMVLESDELCAADWLSVVVQLPVKISAIYTSGGKSVHVLVRVDAEAKAAFDGLRESMERILAPVGVDPAAMTAVRLSRLPGMLRGRKPQELLYLNANPKDDELQTLKPIR